MLLADEVDPYPAGMVAGPITLMTARRAARPREVSMRMREKGKTDGEIVSMGWDEAQAALQAGTHEVADAEGSGSEMPREGEGLTGGEGDGQGDDGLEAKTRPELETLAAERGIDVSKAKTKADVIEALRAPR